MTNFSPFEGTIRIIDGPPVRHQTKIKEKRVEYLSVSCEILLPEFTHDVVTLIVFGPNITELEPHLYPGEELQITGDIKTVGGDVSHAEWITWYSLYTYIETLEKPLELPERLLARLISPD